jgi:hypothetical protein
MSSRLAQCSITFHSLTRNQWVWVTLQVLAAKGPLQPALDVDRAGDVMWTLIDNSLH